MLLRLIANAGLVAFGYYVGKQVGRMEPIRDELRKARAARVLDAVARDQEIVVEAEVDTDDKKTAT